MLSDLFKIWEELKIAGILSWNRGTFKKGIGCYYKNNQRINKMNAWFPGANPSERDCFMLRYTKPNRRTNQTAQQQPRPPHWVTRRMALQFLCFLSTSGSCKCAQILSLQRSNNTPLSPSQGAQPSQAQFLSFACWVSKQRRRSAHTAPDYVPSCCCLTSSRRTRKGLVQPSTRHPADSLEAINTYHWSLETPRADRWTST